ncbi:hypothetical protein HDU93_004527 [Gonapodya sp. JEL0774]|nr:hypothetical protein HDU93_004527 [Gonapodya sp. JEL0774]
MIDALPPEILLGLVVPWLGLPSRLRLASTCSKFRHEIFGEIAVWSSIDFVGSQVDVGVGVAERTGSATPRRFCNVQLVTDALLTRFVHRIIAHDHQVTRTFTNLTKLVLRGSPVTFQIVWRIVHDLVPPNQLKLLDLRSCYDIVWPWRGAQCTWIWDESLSGEKGGLDGYWHEIQGGLEYPYGKLAFYDPGPSDGFEISAHSLNVKERNPFTPQEPTTPTSDAGGPDDDHDGTSSPTPPPDLGLALIGGTRIYTTLRGAHTLLVLHLDYVPSTILFQLELVGLKAQADLPCTACAGSLARNDIAEDVPAPGATWYSFPPVFPDVVPVGSGWDLPATTPEVPQPPDEPDPLPKFSAPLRPPHCPTCRLVRVYHRSCAHCRLCGVPACRGCLALTKGEPPSTSTHPGKVFTCLTTCGTSWACPACLEEPPVQK